MILDLCNWEAMTIEKVPQFLELIRRIAHHPEHVREFVACTPPVKIQVEDDRTTMTPEGLQRAFSDNLYYILGKEEENATPHDRYMALAFTVRDRLLHRWLKTKQIYAKEQAKVICYLSAEYLIGRQLGMNLINVGLFEKARELLKAQGYNLLDLLEQEDEPGLGNGGLGRLAACFMDSLATLAIPAIGYGLRYEFGIFEQVFQDGWQVERPDKWLRYGNPWEIPRPEYLVEVKLGGHTETYTDTMGRYRVRWIGDRTVLGTPYDTLMPGYNNNTCNTLRLWSARASEEFNLQGFNSGDYLKAVAEKTFSENISKVLYPNDNTVQGKELRLEQEYFFTSCSLQDILRFYLSTHRDFDQFTDKIAIQINDTHPSIGVVELLRLLLDEYGLPWDQAWTITEKSFGYTNHTLLSEALERWPVDLFRRLLPRHLELIYEINHRFLLEVQAHFPGDPERVRRMSLIGEGYIRMAYLACVGSHAVNGVAALHTDLLKQDVLRDFYELWPQKFSNKTNGVTPRRWILLSNPKLALLITEALGNQWLTDASLLQALEGRIDDLGFYQQWQQIKLENKQDLTEYIRRQHGLDLDPHTLFDVQVKRIHEYKRQLLNALYIITLYQRLKANPNLTITPRTFIFGGKAAPGYQRAKLIIKLINNLSQAVNQDPDIRNQMKVVYLSNFNVSLGQRVYPAADLSEQISTAGKEASGTGNMKFAMNGALTIGTLDGANIEIRASVGAENFFLFGLTAAEVAARKANGYRPWEYAEGDPELASALQLLDSGYFCPEDRNLFKPLVQDLWHQDPYMLLADYRAYVDCQEQVSSAYQDRTGWTRRSILNTARMGKFSSDRTISEYSQEIWQTRPVPIVMLPAASDPAI